MSRIDRAPAGPTFDPSESEPAAAPAEAAPAAQVSAVKGRAVRSPEEAVRAFYDAFTAKRLDAVEPLYAPNVRFQDEIFAYEERGGTMNMWRSIFAKGPDLKTSYKILAVEGDTVKAHWVADYTFLGRKVHNEIDTTMKVKDGRIVEHRDFLVGEVGEAGAPPRRPGRHEARARARDARHALGDRPVGGPSPLSGTPRGPGGGP